MLCCVVIFFCFTPPSFEGPSKVIDYNDAMFRAVVLDDSTSVQYITMFDTTWAYGNEYVKGLFSELSNEYSSESIVFLHVDLTRSQTLADQLQVNISGYSGEIPTFICFRKV